MGRKKEKMNKPEKPVVNNFLDIDYDKLASAIVNAQVVAKEKEQKSEEEKKTRDNEVWKKQFGYDESKPVTRITSFIRLLFVKKKDIKGDRATFALLKMSAELILAIAKWALYLFFAGCLLVPIYAYCTKQPLSVGEIITGVLMGLLAFIYARILRIAEIEIENLTDREYLNTIIASITALIAMVVSIISVLR